MTPPGSFLTPQKHTVHSRRRSSPILWREWRHPDARESKNSRKYTGFGPNGRRGSTDVCAVCCLRPTQPRKLTKPNTAHAHQSRRPLGAECTPPSMEWCRRSSSSSVWLTSKSFQRMARIPTIAPSSTIRQLTILHVLRLPVRSVRRGLGNKCRQLRY